MKRLSCALLTTFVACSPSTTDTNKDGIADGVKTPNTVSVVAPSTPTGTVSGIVTDTKFVAVGAADVVLMLGGQGDGTTGAVFKAATDVDGNFAFKNIAAGSSGEVVITKTGYGSARIPVFIPGSAGNIPIDNANANVGAVLLTELSATVKFFVYGSTGAPAKGAVGLLEVTPASFVSTTSSSYGAAQGVTSVQATVDETGALVFAGVPSPAEMTRVGGTYSLTVSAWDAAGDGTYDSLGFIRSYSGSALFTNPYQTIVLPDARQSAPLSILASNLDSLIGGGGLPFHNAVAGTNSINVVFNQPVAASTLLTVKVVGEDCSTPVSVKLEQKSANLLTITPTTAWAVGNEYHLAIHATGTDSAVTQPFIGYFWGIDPAAPKPVSGTVAFVARKVAPNTNTNAWQAGDDLFVIFDTPSRYFGGGAAQAFANVDLNSNTTIGSSASDVGEYGNANGLAVSLSEQTFDPTTSTFVCRLNTYGTRYKVTYGLIPPGGVPSGAQMKVVIPKDSAASTGYQTVWGQPFTGEYAGTLTVQ